MDFVEQSEHICWVVDLGLIPYAQAYELQRQLVSARKQDSISDVLLLCEHPHVITLGRNGHRENLLVSPHLLKQMNVEFVPTDRGGDITYHGPGQIVGYPILNLAAIRRDVTWYMRQLEEAMIRATADFGIAAIRKQGFTGVWVERPEGAPEKLAAIGVHLSHWVTSHGFAYNVTADLRYFDLIVPCGIRDKKTTSLERLGASAGRTQVAQRIVAHLGDVLNREMQRVSKEFLFSKLRQLEPVERATA